MSDSPLKSAFAQARAASNIDLITPVFLGASLFVVGKAIPGEATPAFYLTKSRDPRRLCVTVSESAQWLSSLKDVTLIGFTGRDLLNSIAAEQEVIVVYDQGGDYLSAEQLAWMREHPHTGVS
jgi:fimbrial chaperone protein